MRHRFGRKIGFRFKDRYFKPRGIPMRELDEIALSHDELETLRLRYTEGLSQVEAAKKMGISQSQYQRDLWRAHEKVTEALISGKAIRICEA